MTARKNKLDELPPPERCKQLAIALLNRRPLSEKELRDRLAEKDCAPADIDAVIALCLDYGFLNDEQYAGMVARHYAAKAYGPGRIKTELRRRGIREDYWAQALAQLDSPADTLDRLLAARLRGKDVSDRRETDKAAAALFRKGYSWEEIRSALNRYKEA